MFLNANVIQKTDVAKYEYSRGDESTGCTSQFGLFESSSASSTGAEVPLLVDGVACNIFLALATDTIGVTAALYGS